MIQKKQENYAITHNAYNPVHKIEEIVHKFSYALTYQHKGQKKQQSGVIESTDAADAILRLLEQFPQAKGTVKKAIK
ncbi:hypothetical protein [Acinetobacter sp. ANC 3813]|uniref:hypothetical protein n=1 Tax=Acinetobacter sp. ANC 3813 TaxID=1977873 RepID=UPI000A359065|nr:hypothetical protein [Acinetobacter sp. ANC 3813]OTG87846.1 hypothetical protein B9T34_16045 [Acinetobacter sp. ANC 3813]